MDAAVADEQDRAAMLRTQICRKRPARRDQIIGMASYTIVPRISDDGFDVAVVGSNGARQTILNFKTEADAGAWIAQDEQHDRRRDLLPRESVQEENSP
jgi:hypothetical protein